MLDKSLPYKGFIMKMRREKLATIKVPELPPGYQYRLYQDGDEIHWARLETFVLEFPTEEKALAYFNHDYRDPFRDELHRRCAFVTTADGVPVATATAWFMESSLGHKSWLQWISTDPRHQGKGLGRAVVAKALSLYPSVGPQTDIYLHTQTWSHKAVYLYHRIGFEFFLTEPIKVSWHLPPGYRVMENHALEALDVLKSVYSPELLEELRRQAEIPTDDERAEHELLPPFPKEYVP
ncbi:MAG: GNAT family N-acetyltransferase [Victivallales bacterium]|nr:GNAT family N-acetyltransferase [Victivallales bacterium]